jgi:hypothetical protein
MNFGASPSYRGRVIARNLPFSRNTLMKLIASPNVGYKELTAQ